MFYLGRTGAPLISDDFEAWDYDPVIPELYHRVKGFGSGPARNVFYWVPAVQEGTAEFDMLKEAADSTKGVHAGKLVAVTHWKNGAWAKSYQAGLRGIKIPNAAIMDEYRARSNPEAPAAA